MKNKFYLKKTFAFIVLFLMTISIFAQKQVVTFNNAGVVENKISLISSVNENVIISLKLNSYTLNPINNNSEKYFITANGASPILQKGTPDLPKFSQSIIISDINEMKYEKG